MADQYFPNYSLIFNNSVGVPTNYDWASSQGAGGSWQGQYEPNSPTIYQPKISTQAPTATSWLDVINGISVAVDAAGNAIRAFKGMPRLSGGPYDQAVQAAREKAQAIKEEDLLSRILNRYSKDSTEEKRTDPQLLLERSVLDPTAAIRKTGVADFGEAINLPNLTGFRLAGDVFRRGYPYSDGS